HAVVLPVRDIDVAVLVERDAPRLVELPLAAAGLAVLGHRLALRREDLEAVVAAVDDDDVAIGLADDAGRSLQFTGAAAGRAPLADEFALRVENGDGALPLVRHVHVAGLVHRDAERPYGVLIRRAVGREFSEQLLLAGTADLDVIDPHAEIVFIAAVGDVNVAIVAEAHCLRV